VTLLKNPSRKNHVDRNLICKVQFLPVSWHKIAMHNPRLDEILESSRLPISVVLDSFKFEKESELLVKTFFDELFYTGKQNKISNIYSL